MEAGASNMRTEKQASPIEGFAEEGPRQNADLAVEGTEEMSGL